MGLKQTTQCLGYQQITSLATVAVLNPPTGATFAMIAVENQQVRWRDDRVDPTVTIGMPLTPGSYILYDGDLRNIRFIESASGAVLNVSYYN